MLKFWTTGSNDDAFVIASAEIRLERSPGASYVADRDGIPHRIEGAAAPKAVRMRLAFPENLLALENGEPLGFETYLRQLFEGRGLATMMESTESDAYQFYIEDLDGRVGARRGRLRDEDDFVTATLWLKKRGTFSDWDNLASITWEE